MKNQYSLWSLYLNKLLRYSFITICICAMQNNLLAHTKNVASTGLLSDQQHTQSIFFEPMLAGNNISQNIKHISETEDAEEARRSARQAEEDAEAAREAAEEARSSTYYDDSSYDDGPVFGFGIGGHRRHRYHGGYRGGHRGGHRGGGRHR